MNTLGTATVAIDAHCHLQSSPQFPADRAQILVDFDETLRSKMLNLSSQHPNTWCVIGTHPWQVGEENPSDWIAKMSRNFIENNSIVGIGELGLDYLRDKSPNQRVLQNRLLKAQLDVASDFELPLVLHCVKAHQELLLALSGFEYGGLIHGFRSSVEIAKEYIKRGFLISVGNAVHAKTGTKLRKALPNIGLENIVIESDAHLIENASLDKTTRMLAEIFKLDIESIERKTRSNLERVFQLKVKK